MERQRRIDKFATASYKFVRSHEIPTAVIDENSHSSFANQALDVCDGQVSVLLYKCTSNKNILTIFILDGEECSASGSGNS